MVSRSPASPKPSIGAVMRWLIMVTFLVTATSAMAVPAAAHIPEGCHGPATELIATEEDFTRTRESLAESIFERWPMFMIEHAMADFTGALVAKTLAEERLTKCIVGE